jgi:glucose/arabinose dehydrogenase
MIELLKNKKSLAQVRHGEIDILGGETLNDLFRAERFDDILAFLESATSVVDPFTGKALVAPGRPSDSAFYLHISDANGIMVGRFSPDEVAIVERWIMGLAKDSEVAPKQHLFRCGSRRVATGLISPVAIATPPNDSGHLYVAEQGGTIQVVRASDGEILPMPFLALTDINSGGERGLLGLAFHPDFANNRTFYVNCTNSSGATEIRSYQVKEDSPEADPASKQVLLIVPQPFRNHNGGWIAFGPTDGFLYIGMGDGGSANDPHNNAQNLNSLLGKILRIDVNRDDFPDDPARNYAIPRTNPFISVTGARPEIWAYGLRNPWRCSFDRRTGDLYIADVGQNKREEINLQPGSSTGGENYGWRIKEGTSETGLGSTSGLTLVDPIHEYGHADGFAVIGGFVYRGQKFPAMNGAYFFGDHGGRIWTLMCGKSPQLDLSLIHI